MLAGSGNTSRSNLDQSNSQIMITKSLLRTSGVSGIPGSGPRVERSRFVTSSSDEEPRGLKRSYLDRKKNEEKSFKKGQRGVLGAVDLSQIPGTGDADGLGVLCISDEVDFVGTVEEQ